MLRRAGLTACVVASFLMASSFAFATTLLRMDFDDLAGQADRVVIGTVASLDGRLEETGRFVHTDVTLTVERYLAGTGDDTIVLRTPGGQAGGLATVAHGAPSFTVGERVLLFLTEWEDGTPKVLGYAQGKSTVRFDDRLEGGVVDGRSVTSVVRELARGEASVIPLRPAR